MKVHFLSNDKGFHGAEISHLCAILLNLPTIIPEPLHGLSVRSILILFMFSWYLCFTECLLFYVIFNYEENWTQHWSLWNTNDNCLKFVAVICEEGDSYVSDECGNVCYCAGNMFTCTMSGCSTVPTDSTSSPTPLTTQSTIEYNSLSTDETDSTSSSLTPQSTQSTQSTVLIP